SESFWVITGTTKEHKLSKDVAMAAKSNATVIILMGMSKLGEIVSLFKNQQKDQMPVAIIQNGTTTYEQIGIGTVATIENVVSEKGLSNPAIIVIGEVVREREILLKVKQKVEAVEQTGEVEIEERNELYPVFLNVHNLETLIVGGGKVALEKLGFLLKSSPNAKVRLVAPSFDTQVIEMASQKNLKLIHDTYHS